MKIVSSADILHRKSKSTICLNNKQLGTCSRATIRRPQRIVAFQHQADPPDASQPPLSRRPFPTNPTPTMLLAKLRRCRSLVIKERRGDKKGVEVRVVKPMGDGAVWGMLGQPYQQHRY